MEILVPGWGRHAPWTGDWSSDVCSSDLSWWPVIEEYPVSVAVTVWDPAVTRVTPPTNVLVPESRSEERRVGSEGESVSESVLVKGTGSVEAVRVGGPGSWEGAGELKAEP